MSRFVTSLGEQVAELAELAADEGRLSRGRTLFRKGSVSDLSVIEGSVIAGVRGSEGDEYETTIGTALATPGVTRQIAQGQDPENPRTIDDLVAEGLEVCPREIDLTFSCDCADWEEPCKHVVAVLLAFADRVDLDEHELLHWRGVDLTALRNEAPAVQARPGPTQRPRSEAETEGPRRSRPTAGVRASPPSPPISQAESAPAVDPADRTARLSELEALLGDTVMRVPTGDPGGAQPPPTSLDPTLAQFLGVGTTLDPLDLSRIGQPAPLFANVQLGPLGDLGPELADAMAIIMARLADALPQD